MTTAYQHKTRPKEFRLRLTKKLAVIDENCPYGYMAKPTWKRRTQIKLPLTRSHADLLIDRYEIEDADAFLRYVL